MPRPPKRRVGAVMVAVMLLMVAGVVGLAHTASATAATGPATNVPTASTTDFGQAATDPATYASQVRYRINQARLEHELRPLREDPCADSFAQRWALFLAADTEFVHQDLQPMLGACHGSYAGEALIRGPRSPRDAVDLLLGAADHRQILLGTAPDRVGVGARVDRQGHWVVIVDLLGS